jgi:hypothetical protein
MNAAGMRVGAVTVGDSPGSCGQDTQVRTGVDEGPITTDNPYSQETASQGGGSHIVESPPQTAPPYTIRARQSNYDNAYSQETATRDARSHIAGRLTSDRGRAWLDGPNEPAS